MHDWPATAAEAGAIQDLLRPLVRCEPMARPVRTAAGLDVAYHGGDGRLAAAVVVLDADTLESVDQAVVVGRVAFDYAPGLLAFRELPALVAALERLRVTPDLLVCDGHGLAHPRRFGLASHVGVLTGLPAVGVAKRRLVGTFDEMGLGSERGAWSALRDRDEVVGRALRTRAGVRPVFVSVGHRIDLGTACQQVLKLCTTHRLPETTRLADQLARRTARATSGGTNASSSAGGTAAERRRRDRSGLSRSP